jgi:hypothetical protein
MDHSMKVDRPLSQRCIAQVHASNVLYRRIGHVSSGVPLLCGLFIRAQAHEVNEKLDALEAQLGLSK